MSAKNDHNPRTARLLAVFALGAHYHSGMRSRGYRLSCRAARLLERIAPRDWLAEAERIIRRDEPLSPRARGDVARLYFELADRYGEEL